MKLNLKWLLYLNGLAFILFSAASAQLAQPIFKSCATLITERLTQNAIQSGIQTKEGASMLNSILLTPATNVEGLKARKACLSQFVSMKDKDFDQVRSDVKELSSLIQDSFINKQLSEIYQTTQRSLSGNSDIDSALKMAKSKHAGNIRQNVKNFALHKWTSIKNFWSFITNKKIETPALNKYVMSKSLALFFSALAIQTIYRWLFINGTSVLIDGETKTFGVTSLPFTRFLVAALASLISGFVINKLASGNVGMVSMFAVIFKIASSLISNIFNVPVNFISSIIPEGTGLMAGFYTANLTKFFQPLTQLNRAITILGRLIARGYTSLNSVFELGKINLANFIGTVDAFAGVAAFIRRSQKNQDAPPVNIVSSEKADSIKIGNAWDIIAIDPCDLKSKQKLVCKDLTFDGKITKDLILQLMMHNSFGTVFGAANSGVMFIDFNSTFYFDANGEILKHAVNWQNFENPTVIKVA